MIEVEDAAAFESFCEVMNDARVTSAMNCPTIPEYSNVVAAVSVGMWQVINRMVQYVAPIDPFQAMDGCFDWWGVRVEIYAGFEVWAISSVKLDS